MIGYVQGIVDFLDLLGAVAMVRDGARTQVKTRSEIALYLLRCLAAYAESGISAFADWDTEGVDQHLTTHDDMHKVVNLIHTLEQRRQRLVDGAEPLRHQQVAQAVIKRSMHDNPNGTYLVQYDRGAGSYQLVGGRFRESDGNLKNTLIRELSEELGLELQYGRDFDLTPLAEDVSFERHSMTFGILTGYTTNYYHLSNLGVCIPQNSENRWVSFEELCQGQTSDGYPISSDVILQQSIDWQALPDSFRRVPGDAEVQDGCERRADLLAGDGEGESIVAPLRSERAAQKDQMKTSSRRGWRVH